MGLCQTASPSPTASSMDAFWPPHPSPSSSALCSVRQKRTYQTASTSISEQTTVSSTFGVFSHARKPPRNSSLSCSLLTTAPFSPTRRKPYSTSSTASLMQQRTTASPSSLKKTEVLYQPPPREAYSPHISIDGTNLNAMEHFTCLGSVISSDATVSKDLDNCLSKANSSFGRLSKRVWQSHSLRLSTKLQVYRAVVVPTLLYGAETGVLYRKQIRLLERFHKRIKWQDHVSNEEVLKRASLPSIESILLQVQNRSPQPPTNMQELTINLPNNPCLRGMSHHHHDQ